jgi:hypothetical protein
MVDNGGHNGVLEEGKDIAGPRLEYLLARIEDEELFVRFETGTEAAKQAPVLPLECPQTPLDLHRAKPESGA